MRAMAWLLRVLSGIGLLSLLFVAPAPGQAQTTSTTFPQTGHTVSDPFLSYWQAQGGLAQFGYPISDVLSEVSPLDGHSYQVQYFQRAEFELHPENAAPDDVLLTQLGTLRYRALYPTGAPGQQASADNAVAFPETGHSLGGLFRTYWEQHGGLAVQGYPISDEFTEVSPLDGKAYTVQYFERAVFELHPENTAPYDVLLTQLGTLRYQAQYGGGTPAPAAPTSPAAPTATPLPIPGGTPLPQVPPGISTGCSGVPASQNATADPPCGPQETVFQFTGSGFQPGETVSVWFTWPDGHVQTPGFQVTAGPDGVTRDVSFTSHISTSPGDWAVTMQGLGSQVQAIAHFRILPTLPNTAPPNTAQCNAAGSIDGQAAPPIAKLGSTIEITAWNFRQGEKTRAWFTTPAGVPVAAQGVPGIYIHPGGVLGPYPIDTGAGVFAHTPGRWALTVHGTVSGHESVIYFCLFQ